MMNEKEAEKRYNIILRKVYKMVGKNSTTTSELMAAGRKVLGNDFRGVFPVDRLGMNTLSHTSPYCIVNLDSSHQTGSHWIGVAMRADRRKEFIVYDSFGRHHSQIVPSLKYFDLISTDSDAEQRVSEDSCGARSLAWLIFVSIYGDDAGMLI